MNNSFATRDTLAVGDNSYEIFSLRKLAATRDVSRLPCSLKILLENLLRYEDERTVKRADIEALSAELEQEVAALDTAFDAQAEELGEIVIRAKSTDIHVAFVGLAWMPYRADQKGRLYPAWS